MDGLLWNRSYTSTELPTWTGSTSSRTSYGVHSPSRLTSSRYPSFTTSSQYTTQQKIDELENHLRELRENGEAWSTKLARAEELVWELDAENKSLRTQQSFNSRDGMYGGDTFQDEKTDRLKLELSRLREDLRILREATRREELIPRDNLPSLDFSGRYDDGYRSRDLSGTYRSMDNDVGLTEWGAAQLDGSRRSRSRQSRSPLRSLSPTCSAWSSGFRSILPRPLVTQHNRNSRSPSPRRYDIWCEADDRRSFVPKRPADVSLGDRVQFRRPGACILSKGTVKYVGHLPGKSQPYLGVEIEYESGNHDGIYEGFRYFQCKPGRGIFIPFDRVTSAWSRVY